MSGEAAVALTGKPIKVLFLCTGNSARSIMAEAILNALGGGRFVAQSAGSHPSGRVNPVAITRLIESGHATDNLRSKSWEAFAGPDAAAFDYVITVCDRAAGESCPVWSGSPVRAHWGIPDPAAVQGDEQTIREAFDLAYRRLERRIAAMLDLPLERMARDAVAAALREIGGQ